MLGKYYLMCVGHNGQKLERPYNIGLSPMDLKDKKRSISWMKIGSGEKDDYRVAKRISKTEFQCVDTSEVFVITERGAFTVEAFERFLNEVV